MAKKNKFIPRLIASSLMTSIVSYSATAGLRALETKTNLQKNILEPYGVYDFLTSTTSQNQIVIGVVSTAFLMFMFSKLGGKGGRYEDASSHGVHGTSRWGKPSELMDKGAMSKQSKFSKKDPFKALKAEEGTVLGVIPGKNEMIIMPKGTSVDNRNVLLIGASGSGKGQAFVYNNILNNHSGTMVVTDPKGEIYNNTAKIKEDQGYKVFQLDFLNMTGARYNPLDYVNEDIDAIKLASTISKNSSKDGKEDFFFNTAKDLLTGLIIYCKEQYPNASIKDVKKEFYKISESEEYLQGVCEFIGNDHPAYNYLKDASVQEGKTRSSILSSFAQQTSIFSTQKIEKLTETSDFSFNDFQEEKSIIYVKIPMNDNPFEALTATFFEQLISVFYDIALNSKGEKLPFPTTFLFDEFANLGKINNYQKTLSTCRGLGIAMFTIIQDLGQLEEMYGKEITRSITNNHDTTLFLRTKDPETAKFFSGLAGDTTAKMSTNSTSQSGGFFSSNSSSSKSNAEQYVKRPLITEGELMNIDKNSCVLFVSGFFPLMLNKAWQFNIYGDFLFNKDRENNYETYRKRYLKMLGVTEKPSVVFEEDETQDNKEVVKLEEEESQNESHVKYEPVDLVKEDHQEEDVELSFQLLAQEFLMDGLSEVPSKKKPNTSGEGGRTNQESLFNTDLIETDENSPINALEELSSIMNLNKVGFDQEALFKAETNFHEIEKNKLVHDHLDVLFQESENLIEESENYINKPENVNDQHVLEF